MDFSCYNIKENITQYLIKCKFLTIIYISHHKTIKKKKRKKKEIKSKSQQISLKSR